MAIAGAADAVAIFMPNRVIKNFNALADAVSVGTIETGKPGEIAIEIAYEAMYKIVATYKNTDPPPKADIETRNRVFWDMENLKKIQIELESLLANETKFTTRTGDGSSENPIIVLEWERKKIDTRL